MKNNINKINNFADIIMKLILYYLSYYIIPSA